MCIFNLLLCLSDPRLLSAKVQKNYLAQNSSAENSWDCISVDSVELDFVQFSEMCLYQKHVVEISHSYKGFQPEGMHTCRGKWDLSRG